MSRQAQPYSAPTSFKYPGLHKLLHRDAASRSKLLILVIVKQWDISQYVNLFPKMQCCGIKNRYIFTSEELMKSEIQ